MAERDSLHSRGDEVDYEEIETVVRPDQPVFPGPAVQEQTGGQQAAPDISMDQERVVLEPVSANLYDVPFCCLLIPRFPTHYLMGDLVVSLQDWMPQICLSFGWRLEMLHIRPAHMQWALHVHPTTSPGQVMRTFRRQTSQRIFEDFPRLKRENLSDDFWAPGYLITAGTQPHPADRIDQFVRMTRNNQGIAPG